MKMTIAFFLILFASSAMAQTILMPHDRQFNNSCSLPQMREFKKDLAPVSLSFQKEFDGSIVAFVKIRNIGNVRFDGSVAHAMNVKINGVSVDALLSLPIEISDSKLAMFTLAPGSLAHCEEVTITIDEDSRAGQFGCGVYSNDTEALVAFEKGQIPLCL